MKFKFAAIDHTARVVRGVLRAESESDARDLLMGEQVYPKQLSPADDAEPVTWVPRTRVLERARAASAPTADEKLLFGPVRVPLGFISITATYAINLTLRTGEVLHFTPADLEEVRVLGWPRRFLRITTLTGQMYEIPAGIFLTAGWAQLFIKTLDKAK